MYRVLVADDEIHVCQLVQYLIDWDALGLELVGTALNGVDAFEQIVSQKPDIVISDIRMSGYSGIELLEKARALDLRCQFILISGYRQFEYAQKAIQFGVTDYLVKPLKKAEFESALRKAVAALVQESGKTHSPASRPDPAPGGRERLIADLQSGGLPFAQATRDRLREYNIDLSGACQVLFWRFLCHGSYADETLDLLQDKATAYLETQSGAWFHTHLLLRRDDGLALVGAAHNPPGFRLMRDGCQAVISIFSDWETVLGVDSLLDGEALGAPLARACDAAYSHLFDTDRAIHRGAPAARSGRDFHAAVSHDACGRLIAAMQILDADTVRACIAAGFAALENAPDLCADAVFGYARWCIGEMNHALSAFETGGDTGRYLDRAALERVLRHMPTMRAVEQQLTDALCSRIVTVREAVRSAENRPVRLVKDIVARRYMEPISLNDVAAAVDLNPVYLSVLFKKETGTNFKDYLASVRIETAKSLLRDGENLAMVAEKVGYKDAKYFSKLFTRVVGVNPTQYKKLYN